MNRDQANDLFCSHAFHGQDPPVAYKELVESFMQFCGGLPLSLKVLGAHLYGRKEYYWELELEKAKKIQPMDIMERLKIRFDGLDQEEKEIFIDIAFFFNKIYDPYMKRNAILIWKASSWSTEHALQTLMDKSLVEINNYYFSPFEMHDHLRDIGRQMADDLRPTRLWRPQILRSMNLERLNTLDVRDCPELETMSGLSSLTGLQSLIVEDCPNLETISELSSLTGLQSLVIKCLTMYVPG
ncbi:hypothetical protein SUGI_0595460 [Cryptomeria japonica]|nr:hypothetical protein SUGI_0595460 [Cryptomeria japonica]